MSRRRTSGGAGGFVAVELAAGVAVLLLPVVFLVVGLPAWPARQSVARAAARDAARVVVLEGWCDGEAAARRVEAAADAAALGRDDLRLDLDCVGDADLPRGGAVTARVTVAMPALVVPLVGSVPGWSWTAVHREPVDPYGSRR